MAIDAGRVVAVLALETGEFSNAMSTAKSQVTTFRDETVSTAGKVKALGSAMTSLGQTMTLGVTLPLVGLGAAAVTTFAGFDDSMRLVQATMTATAEDMEKLTAAAKQMGATTRYTASQAAQALNYLALAGYNADQAITALPTVLDLAQAGGLDLAYASDLVTDSMSALGIAMGSLTGFTDQLAKTSQKSNTNIAQLGEAILTVGGTARMLAGGTVELNTELGILADNGIKGAEGGTALRNIILALSAPTDTAAKAIKEMGLKAFDADGNLRPMNETFTDLNAILSTMTQQKRTEVLNEIFNKVDLKSANALLANSGARFNELSGYITDADGAAQQMAETMEGGLGGAFRNLSSAVEGLAIEYGENLAPTLQDVTTWVTELTGWFASLSEETQNTIVKTTAIAAAVGPVLIVGGKLITMIGTGVKLLSGPVGWVALLAAVGVALFGLASNAKSATAAVAEAMDAVGGADTSGFNLGVESVKKTVTPEVTVNNAKVSFPEGVTNLYDMIFAALTDGKPDTQLVTDELNEAANSFFTDAISGVKLNTSEELTALQVQFDKGFIDADTYASRVNAVNKKSAEMIDQIETMRTETLRYIEEYAGQPTKVVQDTKDTLDGLAAAVGLTMLKLQGTNFFLSMGAKTLYDTVYQGLLGEYPDTDTQADDLETKVNAYYADLISKVEIDAQTQLDALNAQLDAGAINAEEYAEKAASINASSASMIESLKLLETDTLALIGNLAGATDDEVSAAEEQIATLETRLQKILADIGLANAAYSEVSERSVRLVRAGATTDQQTIGRAFGYVSEQYKLNEQQFADDYAAERDEAQAEWNAAVAAAEAELQQALLTSTSADEKQAAMDSAERQKQVAEGTYKQAEESLQKTLATQTEQNLATYEASVSELFSGIAELYPELAAQLVESLGKANFAEEISKAAAGAASEGKINITEEIAKAVFDATGRTLQTGEIDTSNMVFETREDLVVLLNSVADQIASEAAAGLKITEEDGFDNTALGVAWKAFVENGLLAPLAIDPTDLKSRVKLLIGELDAPAILQEAADEVFGPPAPEDAPKIDIPIHLMPQAVQDMHADMQAALDAASADKSNAITVSPELIITEPIIDDKSFEDLEPSEQVRARLQAQGMTLGDLFADDALAGLQSAVNAGVSDAEEAGNALGQAVVDGGEDALDPTTFKGLGQDAADSLISGVSGRQTRATAIMRILGRSMVAAFRDELGMHSPSTVLISAGHDMGDSVVIGIEDKMDMVRGSMRKLVDISNSQGVYPDASYFDSQYASSSGLQAQTPAQGPTIIVNINNPTVANESYIRKMNRDIGRYIGSLQYGVVKQ